MTSPEPAQAAEMAQDARPTTPDAPILEVRDLVKHFDLSRSLFRRVPPVQAVSGVSFEVGEGETVGVVGESGCGKSTVGRCIIGLERPTSGQVLYEGSDVGGASRRELRRLRRDMQFVFQDPFSSLNPLMTVYNTLAEPLRLSGWGRQETRERVHELLETVGLSPEHGNRFPHEFSGGQRQRIGIARALALRPRMLILDEPVSALDVSIQAQVVNLLEDLQERFGLAYLFIAHDLSVVRHTSDRVVVMYLGKVVEVGTRDQVFNEPAHPYTQALLSAVPPQDPAGRERRRRVVLEGDVPSPADPPSGCRFRTRCWKADDRCATEEPALLDRLGHGHPSACHYPEQGRSDVSDLEPAQPWERD